MISGLKLKKEKSKSSDATNLKKLDQSIGHKLSDSLNLASQRVGRVLNPIA